MKHLFFFLFVAVSSASYAQIISQFDWDSGAVTTATVGPNGTTTSSAITDINGAHGSNGLNASLPKADLDMTLPGSPTFDVDGIDVSFDYQRDESQGTFWRRGSSLIINGCNNLSVSYRVNNGAGGFTTVSSGNVYSIPNDDTFRNYRFFYLPTTGEGFLMVDGVVIWSNDGPDNRKMYWNGAGDVMIGYQMDGSGQNKTFFDNMVVGNVSNSALPIELIDFNAKLTEQNQAKLTWLTSSELNNDYFEIEKSVDGLNWELFHRETGAGTTIRTQFYTVTDEDLDFGTTYYRLSQIDFDGKKVSFDIQSVMKLKQVVEVLLYPNPVNDVLYIESSEAMNTEEFSLLSADGRQIIGTLDIRFVNENLAEILVSHLPTGTYFFRPSFDSEFQKVIIR